MHSLPLLLFVVDLEAITVEEKAKDKRQEGGIMFEIFGLTYLLSKDLKDYSAWDEEDERVVSSWPEKSGFKEQAEKHGIAFLWSFPEQLESYCSAGYEIVYEIDKANCSRKRFVLKDGSILVGKKTR